MPLRPLSVSLYWSGLCCSTFPHFWTGPSIQSKKKLQADYNLQEKLLVQKKDLKRFLKKMSFLKGYDPTMTVILFSLY